MSDSRLRDLERRALGTGALDDYVRWRAEAVRSQSDFPLLLRDDCEYEVHTRKYPMCVSSARRFYARQDDCIQPLSSGRPRCPSISELVRLQMFLREGRRPVVSFSQVPIGEADSDGLAIGAVGVCVGVAYTPQLERIKIVQDVSFLSGNPGSGYRVDFDSISGNEYKFSESFFERGYFSDSLNNPLVRDLVQGDIGALVDARIDSVESPFPAPHKVRNQRHSLLHCVTAAVVGGVLSLECNDYFDSVLVVKKKHSEAKERVGFRYS